MPKKTPRTGTDPKTLLEAVAYFKDPAQALAYVIERRWPDGEVKCPTCGSGALLFLKNQQRWKCSNDHPRRQFSIKVGTIMEDSPIGLDKWLPAIWMVTNCKNGISSYELARDLDVTQKTAWFMLHRARLAMQDSVDGGKLDGTVEADETFIGGLARNMHKHKRAEKITGTGGKGKALVMGLLDRKTKTVRVKHLADRTRKTLHGEVYANVEPGSEVFTDDFVSYTGLSKDFVHQFVNHAERYVDGNVHTNGLENFWSLLKRTLKGTYVAVEPFHLFRYLDEQAFRFNERKGTDQSRFMSVLLGIAGKRLTYKALIGEGTPEGLRA
jgi:transposase-like protein